MRHCLILQGVRHLVTLEVVGVFRPPAEHRRALEEMVMAKGQMRGNREAKKPKKVKVPEAPTFPVKGTPISIGPPKKKG